MSVSSRARAVAAIAAIGAVVALVPATRTSAARAGATEPPAASGVQVERGVVYRTIDGASLALDAYLPAPAPAAPTPAIVLVHDGGWQGGNRASMATQAAGFAAAGFAAFAIDYRLAPQFRFPAAVEDVEAAVQWLRDPAQSARYRIDGRRIGLFGASAGGNLAALVGVLGSGPLDQGARVAAVASWSGPMVLTEHAVAQLPGVPGSAVVTYLGCKPARCRSRARAASPAANVDAGDSPIFLANSTHEIVPAQQARSMAAVLALDGVPHELAVVHGTLHARELEPQVWSRTLQFLRDHLGA